MWSENITDQGFSLVKFESGQILYGTTMPILCLLVIILNFIVVVSSGLILRNRPQPRSTYLFLGNVALADFVTGTSWLFGLFFPEKYSNHYTCAIHEGLQIASTLVSILSVGLISFDRYLYILHGWKYETLLDSHRVYKLIIVVWIIGCFIGYLPLMGWYGDTNNGKICWVLLSITK